ncbi:unnamed protein product [Notodromas monacha]|uniref:GOLD domain-containing protein n=1 Tax=Notodromas monacha TaxID=399045 RepID=A0A7R9BGY8_9CRUS|nr:unnamed protein product [Notodromas monacha]CAG0915270.1 unnamed protein product [Notodromas monacha]
MGSFYDSSSLNTFHVMCLVFWSFIGPCRPLQFDLKPMSTRCLSEGVQKDETVLVRFNVTLAHDHFIKKPETEEVVDASHPVPAVHITATDHSGQILAKRQYVRGPGSFLSTSDFREAVTICFASIALIGPEKTLSDADFSALIVASSNPDSFVLNIRLDVDHDNNNAAEANRDQGSTTTIKEDLLLRKLLLDTDAIAKRFAAMIENCEEFHGSHEFTKKRFTNFCAISLAGLFSVTIWQFVCLVKLFSHKQLL